MKRIILSGCNGRMGRVVRGLVSSRDDCVISAGIDVTEDPGAEFPIFSSYDSCTEDGDVIVDFSNPSLLEGLLRFAREKKIPAVLATTGYSEDQIRLIREASLEIAVFFSFNMSLGVNLIVELAKKAACVLGGQFDIEIIEKHHNQKLDAPSGTAVMLADAINHASEDRYRYVYERQSVRKKREPSEIGIHSIRGGNIVGEHEVIFAGRDEVVSIKHTATSREVFAVGAVNAAVFLAGRPAGMYAMKDLIGD